MKNFTLFIFLFVCSFATAQNNLSIPKSYKNLEYDNQGKLFFKKANGEIVYSDTTPAIHTLERLIGKPQGTATGISFDFGIPDFKGTLYFGFIPYGDSKHPQPVYFRSPAKIENGKAEINITQMKGTYDMVGWVKSGKGTLGYRVVNDKGAMIYDGKISFIYTNNTFAIATTITEGPFINRLTSEGATISLTTNLPAIVSIEIDGKNFSDTQASTQHEILVTGLEPNKRYTYKVNYPTDNQQIYAFRTAPQGGARTKFSFAYASDSRAGQGGGERNMYGANYYIMKKITALAHSKNAAFFQFTGDLIDGYLIDKGETELQYANWKRSVEIFWHYMPIYAAMGNHEALNYRFEKNVYSIDRFPYETESAEAIFAKHFVNPLNGLESEDGSKYDKNKKGIDFPSYKENVFYYVYDNVAVIVLNSNYWFAPSRTKVGEIGGNIHAYIMDNQVAWLKNTLATLEKDGNIDHIFVTEHTPFFPNGGHVRDDMWYGGDNNPRPCFAEGCADKGIIERRDEMLDLLVNQSTKVRAILTGDEHNYAKTKLTPETIIHPENYPHQKVKLSRTIWQINNGAAGAPYYAQEQTPWTPFVSGFSTQNAVVFFHVEGKKIFMEVFNPDTLEKFDELQLVD
ncbi:MAG: metallophosphoesterase [Thermoflexibacter sp.]|jgi:hypothetical protein|nr:metallophosphoesterase [Thermoflexibacter sp.]